MTLHERRGQVIRPPMNALFITIDPYWHSDMTVDTMLANGGRDNAGKSKRDGWDITHGEAQYRWLKQTLEQSNAKYKFMFAHHVSSSAPSTGDGRAK